MLQHDSIISYNVPQFVSDCASYSQLCDIISKLVTAVVHSIEKLNCVMSHVTEWLQRLRINEKFKPPFTIMNSKEDSANVDTSISISMIKAISAIAAPVKLQHFAKRLISST